VIDATGVVRIAIRHHRLAGRSVDRERVEGNDPFIESRHKLGLRLSGHKTQLIVLQDVPRIASLLGDQPAVLNLEHLPRCWFCAPVTDESCRTERDRISCWRLRPRGSAQYDRSKGDNTDDDFHIATPESEMLARLCVNGPTNSR